MWFETPDTGVRFEIPDDWWAFAEMDSFSLNEGGFYPYSFERAHEIEVVSLSDIQPPMRGAHTPPFKKYKLVPILFAFASPECVLPPVEVVALAPPGRYRFKVLNGYHRYYASVAVGYNKLPIVIRQPFNP
jgi:hypothetical protein